MIGLYLLNFAEGQSQMYCENDEFCDRLDNNGFFIETVDGNLRWVYALGGDFFFVKEEAKRVYLNFWKCHYCVGETTWSMTNSSGDVLFENELYLTGDSQRIEIPNLVNLPLDTYRVVIKVPQKYDWDWTFVTREPRECEKELSQRITEGWKFSYNAFRNGFVLTKIDSISYSNPYLLIAKKEQHFEQQKRMESFFQINPEYRHLPQFYAKYQLEFWWDLPQNHASFATRAQKQDSILSKLRSKFLNDSLLGSYREYSRQLSNAHIEPRLFLSQNENSPNLAIYMSYPNFLDMKASDKAEIESLLLLVKEILEED